MGTTYLDEIVDWHRQRARRDQRDWRERLEHVAAPHAASRFAHALRAEHSTHVAVIAEVKRRSPSKGPLDLDLDVDAVARDYEAGGATAISVLTDHEFFGGSLDDLTAVRHAVTVPILRKDFTVSENDVLDAADAGAAAVLVIVAAVSDEELRSFLRVAAHCGLDVLVEVHDESELARAVDAGSSVIGVNQRDLRSFTVDPQRAATLAGFLPRHCVKVCESGLRTVEDVRAAASAGFDAVLVGETFVLAPERRASVASFASVARSS